MTPSEFKSIRLSFGLSAAKMADILMISDGRVIRRWESGDAALPGPVIVIATALTKSAEFRALLGVRYKNGVGPG